MKVFHLFDHQKSRFNQNFMRFLLDLRKCMRNFQRKTLIVRLRLKIKKNKKAHKVCDTQMNQNVVASIVTIG